MPLHWLRRASTGSNVGDTSDQARFTEVFLPHLVDAFRLAHWIAGSRADAEDIVQEASIRAFKNIRGYSGGNPRAWVLTIVRNTSYSWLAKNRPRRWCSARTSINAERRGLNRRRRHRNAGNGADSQDGSSTGAKAMASLPVPFREVLVLREIHELDYRSIAEVVQYRLALSCRGSRAHVDCCCSNAGGTP